MLIFIRNFQTNSGNAWTAQNTLLYIDGAFDSHDIGINKVETITAPLGHVEERQVGVDRPPAMHQIALRLEHFWVDLLILAGILATSDCKTLRIEGLSGDAI